MSNERTVTIDGVRLTEAQVRAAMRTLERPVYAPAGRPAHGDVTESAGEYFLWFDIAKLEEAIAPANVEGYESIGVSLTSPTDMTGFVTVRERIVRNAAIVVKEYAEASDE